MVVRERQVVPMGPVGVLLGLGGSAIAGTAWGLKARGDDALRMDADVQRDLDSLRSTGALPQGVQPRFSLTPTVNEASSPAMPWA